jgi:N-acetylmuramoyl-L-alanine amidase
MKIALDTGHGGLDPGASGGGMKEKKINFNVATELARLLKAKGHTVMLTRPNDETLDLLKRAKLINAFNPDIAISVHHNAGGGQGYDVIHNVAKSESYTLAIMIAREFELLKQTKHKVFSRTNSFGTDYYGIQRLTKAPLVITEFAFLDSADVKDIDTLAEQMAEADAIYKAIINWGA